MPWHTVKNHKGCPGSKPWAVVKDDDGKKVGCHKSEEAAKKQLAALYASEERSMGKVEELWSRVRDAFDDFMQVPNVSEPVERSHFKIREVEGKYRWYSVSATAILNRVGEIDSRELFDVFCAIAKTTGKYPQRDFIHLGPHGEHYVTGQTDFMYRDGNVFITSGLYNDSELAQLEIAARTAHPEYWGDSIAYILFDAPDIEEVEEVEGVVPVLRGGALKYISTLPEKFAASLHTVGEIQEVERMWNELPEAVRESFIAVNQGDEEKAKAWWERHPDNINRAIEEEGLVTRATDEDTENVDEAVAEEIEEEEEVEESTEEVVEAEAEPEVEEVERTVELESEMVEYIVERVTESTTPLQESLGQLQEDAQVTRANLTRVIGRLEELEKEESERKRQYLQDVPRRELVRVTHRPRMEQIEEEDDGPEPIPERAERTLETWTPYPGS